MKVELQVIFDAIIEGESAEVRTAVQAALDADIPA
jgi:hypothetical protein